MTIEKLHNIFLECTTVNTDTRKIRTNDLFFALRGENFNGNIFTKKALENGAKFAIIDDSDFYIDTRTILVKNSLKTLQELANYHRKYLKIPIIALTGSNGKTTTKELINAVLSQKFKTTATLGNLNNHIGVPLTLLSMSKDTEIGIVEMGANHLKEIEFLCKIAEPDYGYITNFGKAHLEGFGSIEGVIKGKSELYSYLKATNKTIFINTDDVLQVEKTSNYNSKYTIGTKKDNAVTVLLTSAQPFVEIHYNNLHIKSHLIGAYNFKNISTAIGMGNYFKVDDISIKKGIENYIPSNNRSQIISKGNIEIILDAYNANPSSMQVALENFAQLENPNKLAILGDMFELGANSKKEHQYIADLTSNLQLKALLIGEHFYEVNTSQKQHKSFSDLETDFKNIDLSSPISLLIKGSRGMALERILDFI